MEDLKKLIKAKDWDKLDLEDFLNVLIKLGNTYIDVQEEIEDWDCIIQFRLEDSDSFWIETNNARLSFTLGNAPNSNLELSLTKEKLFKIFLKLINLKQDFMAGKLKVEGNLENLASIEKDPSLFSRYRPQLQGKRPSHCH